jgi:photosystem II stability/assembly factor-like uncharacterized protein
MFKVLISLIILSTSLCAQEWMSISPFTDNSAVVSGSFISPDKAWVVDVSHISGYEIFTTNDGGNNWDLIYTFDDFLESISSIFMADSLNGWCTLGYNFFGCYNSYYSTNDGGSNWTDMTDHFIDVEDITASSFINDNIGFTSTINDTSLFPLIYKTIDGGYNWESVQAPIMEMNGDQVYYSIKSFFFLNDLIGWAGCQIPFNLGGILHTTDGGENWSVLIPFGDPYYINMVPQLSFYNENLGGIICHGCMGPYAMITEDNCQTFIQPPFSAETIGFQNESTVWITTMQGLIFRSLDTGDNFIQVYQASNDFIKMILFENTGFFFGAGNNLLKFTEQVEGYDEILQMENDFSIKTFPNPFNPSTSVTFSLSNELNIELIIYNIKGQLVNTLVNEHLLAGQHSVVWDGTNQDHNPVSSGIYFYKFKTNEYERIQKMVLLK